MVELRTFDLPETVAGQASDVELGRALVATWQADGILQVAIGPDEEAVQQQAYQASRRFFGLPQRVKAGHVSDSSYAGYIASGEELTDGVNDGSEVFTVTPDFAADDARVLAGWPCHGPAPWPDDDYRDAMAAWMSVLGGVGERLLRLTALGLGLPVDALTRLTDEGWHHMRVLRFPAASPGNDGRGIGAHTDYGLLVIASQDEVGQALFIRPPLAGERRNRNWLAAESAAGVYEDDDRWTYVKPVPHTLTVFPGDVMQFVTGGELLSTPHKVKLADRERHALAYFHEPAFNAVARPPTGEPAADGDHIHYGTHFTNMFMRSYPDRVTTQRIHAEHRLDILEKLRDEALHG
ncbi:MAG TPA: 2-oxoglutarate and iron-dependent oxygenase domain-containing protein [Actinospica sp.]|nr:2-oxoglutarate and iron-dependent oxygenase domain-containing protein [Actinospica sp.]